MGRGRARSSRGNVEQLGVLRSGVGLTVVDSGVGGALLLGHKNWIHRWGLPPLSIPSPWGSFLTPQCYENELGLPQTAWVKLGYSRKGFISIKATKWQRIERLRGPF